MENKFKFGKSNYKCFFFFCTIQKGFKLKHKPKLFTLDNRRKMYDMTCVIFFLLDTIFYLN